MEITGNDGRKYRDGLEYATDTTRYESPGGQDATDRSDPRWKGWLTIVSRSMGIWPDTPKEIIDLAFHWYSGGYDWGAAGRKEEGNEGGRDGRRH